MMLMTDLFLRYNEATTNTRTVMSERMREIRNGESPHVMQDPLVQMARRGRQRRRREAASSKARDPSAFEISQDSIATNERQTAKQPTPSQQSTAATASIPRRRGQGHCSTSGQQGHNRRGCPTRLSTRLDAILDESDISQIGTSIGSAEVKEEYISICIDIIIEIRY